MHLPGRVLSFLLSYSHIPSCSSEVTAVPDNSCDDCLCRPGSWLVQCWAGGRWKYLPHGHEYYCFWEREWICNWSLPMIISALNYCKFGGHLNPDGIISWRSFWLNFEVRHESGNLDRNFWSNRHSDWADRNYAETITCVPARKWFIDDISV